MRGKVPNKNAGPQDTLLYYESQSVKSKRRNCCCVCCLTVLIITLVIAILGFLLIFVGFPMLFKNSIQLQTSIVFPTEELLPLRPEFGNFGKYNISGSRNFYITVDEDRHVVLGVWHLLPDALVNRLSNKSDECSYMQSLADLDYPVLIHFHENGGNRIKYIEMYKVLRQFFHVIAFDYRGYADSSPVQPTESDIVKDSIALYKWVQSQTEAAIYLWGHGIGSALSAHTAARLHEENIVPAGVFLEAPFPTIKEQLKACSPFKSMFSWMPWYEVTMLEPLETNGFSLNTNDYVLKVDCPIMIVHAKDDYTTPFSLGVKVLKNAQKRDPTLQGSVVFHQLSHKFGFGHDYIYKWDDLSEAIKNHTEVCERFQVKMHY